ncbi:hypothetical protein OG943_19570 [Amycolatopsis sp. NBC_00345]|uniref:hypothetical protein n=1 Tax=Amycolatopsis sp. NBC_00345 TaxID=2975955 RepID=UPI002E27664D
MTAAPEHQPDAAGPNALSCYTANLAAYLLAGNDDALDVIARSVRLAVRPGDEPAFSHHSIPLHQVPAEGELGFAGVPTSAAAIEGMAREIESSGQVLVLANSASMPWSRARAGDGAPHLLLVDGRRGGQWHAVDEFTALLPEGRQDPFQGWLTDEGLLSAIRPSPVPAPEHKLREEHAFGFPVPIPPDGTYQWVALSPGRTAGVPDLPGDWVTGTEAALAVLSEFWAGLGDHEPRRRFLDDMWAAAQHHAYRYVRIGSFVDERSADIATFTRAVETWQNLPMALRFAAESAARGRARPSMVQATFDHLLDADGPARALLPQYGFPAVP